MIKKARLTSKFMMAQPGKQIIAIQIFPNISISKSNQAIKFGQLKEYNMGNIFPEKPYKKCGGESSIKPFSEK